MCVRRSKTSLLKLTNNGIERESKGVGRDMWISLKLFLEAVIKGKTNSWDFRISSQSATVTKHTMQNIVVATVEFSFDNTTVTKRLPTSPETKFRLISRFYWFKNNNWWNSHIIPGAKLGVFLSVPLLLVVKLGSIVSCGSIFSFHFTKQHWADQ